MKIKVKTHGHQHYHEDEGEVLLWTQNVAAYPENRYLQVPAVILKTNQGVKVVNLSQYLYWTEIEYLGE